MGKRIIARIALSIAISASLAACGSHDSATHVASVASKAVQAKPTPPPLHPALVKLRAVQRFVADPASCAALGARVHVATVFEMVPSWLGPRPVCWREVRAGDTAYASAARVAIYAPMARSHESWAFASASTTYNATISTCVAHGQHARVPVIAITTYGDSARCLIPGGISSADSSEDNQSASVQFAVVLPAEDVK